MRIYVASSWRNQRITEVIATLRGEGHEVYDFREDDGSGAAFNWQDIDPNWRKWSPKQFADALRHPVAALGFERDMDALTGCEGLLLVMPCGRSAHLELGVAIGMQKPTAILLSDGEPELMYGAVEAVCMEEWEVCAFFESHEIERARAFKVKASPITKKPELGC